MQEAYGGFSSALVWLLVLHSAQREVRERHHYSVDCIVAIYVGILLWKMTGFIWSREVRSGNRSLIKFENIKSRLIQASKDSDIDKVRELLKEIDISNEESRGQTTIKYARLFRSATIVFALTIVVLAFTLTTDGWSSHGPEILLCHTFFFWWICYTRFWTFCIVLCILVFSAVVFESFSCKDKQKAPRWGFLVFSIVNVVSSCITSHVSYYISMENLSLK